jgi:hypothetical protein
MFIKAIRTGKHMGEASSRPILPPMPWQDFNYLSDDELKDLFAYLKSLPPTKNHVPDPGDPAAFRCRRGRSRDDRRDRAGQAVWRLIRRRRGPPPRAPRAPQV